MSKLRVSTPKTSHPVGDGGHLALISPSIAASEALETACPGGLSGPAATQSLSRDQSIPPPKCALEDTHRPHRQGHAGKSEARVAVLRGMGR